MIPSQSTKSLPPSPDFPPLSAFTSLSGLCSGGSPTPLSSPSSLSRSPMAVRHRLSIEDPDPVGTVSRFTSSSHVDAVDAASSISPLFATLTENTGGGGYKYSTQESRLPSEAPIFLLTSLPLSRLLFRLTHQHPQLQSLHALTSQFSVYRIFSIFPSLTTHYPLFTTHCFNQKQAPSPAVIQPSGHACPGGSLNGRNS